MNTQKTLKIIFGIVIAFSIIGYGFYQSRALIEGPILTISSPGDGETLTDSFITIAGSAKYITKISLNGRSIFIDKDGNFSEKILLLPGYNVLTLKAEDRLGRHVQKEVEVVLHEQNPKYTLETLDSVRANIDMGTTSHREI